MSAPAVASGGAATYELDGVEAQRWGQISEEIGRQLLPALEQLDRSLASLTTVMVATADGLNLAALGLRDDRVERVSAMAGALHSMSSATTAAIVGDPPGGTTTGLLTITHGDATTVVLAVGGLSLGPALLWVTARLDTLGAIIYHARHTVASIEQLGL
ncbi:MAG: hypothetical protein WBQ50_02125 [Nocardioides sp.]